MVGSHLRVYNLSNPPPRAAPGAEGLPEPEPGADFSRLYSRLFPAVLRLAADAEPVAVQMFLPLAQQARTGNHVL